jgi:hypothetical protein
MADGFRFRCELTTDRLEVAAAEVEALVLWAEEASFRFRQARPRIQPGRLRWFGLTMAILGPVVGDLGIVLASDGDWTSWPLVFYYSTIPVFAGAGSFFWFQAPALVALRRWSRRRLQRMVHRLLEPARRRLGWHASSSSPTKRPDDGPAMRSSPRGWSWSSPGPTRTAAWMAAPVEQMLFPALRASPLDRRCRRGNQRVTFRVTPSRGQRAWTAGR